MQVFRKLQQQESNTSKHTSFGNMFSLLNKSIVTQLKLMHQLKSQGSQSQFTCLQWAMCDFYSGII